MSLAAESHTRHHVRSSAHPFGAEHSAASRLLGRAPGERTRGPVSSALVLVRSYPLMRLVAASSGSRLYAVAGDCLQSTPLTMMGDSVMSASGLNRFLAAASIGLRVRGRQRRQSSLCPPRGRAAHRPVGPMSGWGSVLAHCSSERISHTQPRVIDHTLTPLSHVLQVFAYPPKPHPAPRRPHGTPVAKIRFPMFRGTVSSQEGICCVIG